VSEISAPDNNWAIDGTVLQYQNGQKYFVWSGWADVSSPNTQNLYIAQMDSPTHISSDRVLLHEPKPSWQKSELNGNLMSVNEGPQIIENNGRTFLVYCTSQHYSIWMLHPTSTKHPLLLAAAGSWTDDYCLALMGIDRGQDPSAFLLTAALLNKLTVLSL
jgi:GH43 family beta-xylosidase